MIRLFFDPEIFAKRVERKKKGQDPTGSVGASKKDTDICATISSNRPQ